MHSLRHKVTLLVLGLVGLSTLAAVSTFTITANNLAGLRQLNIRPFGDFAIDINESLLMTAEGDYVTYTVALRSVWTIIDGKELGSFIGSCDGDKSCEFHAGDRGGDVRIRAEANGYTADETIHIRSPQPKRPVVNPFIDSIPDWAGEPIVELKDRNIIRGYDDGTYGAGDLLTRGQLVTIFHRVLRELRLSAQTGCPFAYNDVPAEHYAYEAACMFRSKGWTDSLTTLEPDEPVTRGETASLLNRVIGGALLSANDLRLGKVLAEGKVFTDVPLSHQYFGDTAVVNAINIMRGNPDKTFGPSRTLNRAEAATVFHRMMNELEKEGVKGL
jgi:hypothetical protein